MGSGGPRCKTLPSFVKIGQSVVEILQFSNFYSKLLSDNLHVGEFSKGHRIILVSLRCQIMHTCLMCFVWKVIMRVITVM